MNNRKREFKRKSGFRDSKLFVIATEGEKTEVKYFQNMVSKEWYYNSRIHVEVIDREIPGRSPNHVIDLLNEFKKNYRLRSDDELWLVIDMDRWGDRLLSQVLTLCNQKSYHLAVSNPCFELGMLLHLKSLEGISDDEKERLQENRRISSSRRYIESQIINILGSYNRSNPDCSNFLPYVQDAITRAEHLDKNPEHDWPNELGARVYLLVRKIVSISQ